MSIDVPFQKFAKLGQRSISHLMFNSIQNNEILDWSKFKAFADDKINATKKLKFILQRQKILWGKGENAGYLQCFQKASLQGH